MAENLPAGESLALPRLTLTRFDSPLTDVWQTAQIAHLMPTERERLARIDRPLRREQFVVGHSMLRRVLADAEHQDAKIEVDAEGRVRLRAKVPLFASIAHSANAVAVVVGGAPVGVDLESVQPLRDSRAAAAMLGLAAGDAEDAGSVLRAWVTAEARMKAGPEALAQVWRTPWERCQIAVAGAANQPITGVLNWITGTYNAIELQWEAV